jgi:hypothetical protein
MHGISCERLFLDRTELLEKDLHCGESLCWRFSAKAVSQLSDDQSTRMLSHASAERTNLVAPPVPRGFGILWGFLALLSKP